MGLLKVIIVWEIISLLVVWGILWAMRPIYKKENVKVPWWLYTKCALVPFVGGIFIILVIWYDFKHHVVNQERIRRKKHIEDENK